MGEVYLTAEEVAEQIKVSPITIRQWLRLKKIKGVKFGKEWRIKESDWKQWLLDQENQ